MGGTGAKQLEMRQEALDYIRTAPDREEAFAEAVKGIDMALELSLIGMRLLRKWSKELIWHWN